ncbi:MAG: hypothetical protein KUG77_06040 [Nannocystaceae bacterium]|nr:hypothetical protein [Nannocystaceae bacterium]
MRCRLSLWVLLAVPTACFSEPPGVPSSSDGSSGTTALGAEASDGSSGAEGTTTSGGDTTGAPTGLSTSGVAETGNPEEVVLLDLYEVACSHGTWDSGGIDDKDPGIAPCYENVGPPEMQGAVRKLGGNRLLLELPHGGEGFLSGTFVLPKLVTNESDLHLKFDVGCVQPGPGECSIEELDFLLYPFGGENPSSDLYGASVSEGAPSTVDIGFSPGGPNDELVIFVYSNTLNPGESIELIGPRIVHEAP